MREKREGEALDACCVWKKKSERVRERGRERGRESGRERKVRGERVSDERGECLCLFGHVCCAIKKKGETTRSA
jgi:hypothetical protein